MSVGIVLVHGFTGSPTDLSPLSRKLESIHGSESVTTLCLPGHGVGRIPSFDQAAFTEIIADAVKRYRREDRAVIIMGHSSGGILSLAALAEYRLIPDLLILASVPKRIDTTYMERWSRHRLGKNDIRFTSVAQIVSLINSVGSRIFSGSFPVVILHGSEDKLVPCEEAFAWSNNGFEHYARTVIVPSAGHDLFLGTNSALVIDVIVRAIADREHFQNTEDKSTIEALLSVEPEVNRFLTVSPLSGHHIARCPSGQTIKGGQSILGTVSDIEPVFANLEITTRCNFRCTYCARTTAEKQDADMDKKTFIGILGLLPHAYRITLVGLGEPLLHPQAVDYVAEAYSQGRRTALVTNAMLLEPSLSRELIKAGLESITFSIDGPNQHIASCVRQGTDMDRVIKNIKGFVKESKTSRTISTAVFSAVSAVTIPYLEELLDLVSSLDVHVLMLTDLNFEENVSKSLWKNANDCIAATVRRAVSKAFKINLPVLTVRGLEEFGLWRRYGKFLLLSPDQLYRRSAKRTWCSSPWQTVPINVLGDVTLCDCQPDVSIGNLLSQPLADIWNGRTMVEHRSRMLGINPPGACKVCPRF